MLFIDVENASPLEQLFVFFLSVFLIVKPIALCDNEQRMKLIKIGNYSRMARHLKWDASNSHEFGSISVHHLSL